LTKYFKFVNPTDVTFKLLHPRGPSQPINPQQIPLAAGEQTISGGYNRIFSAMLRTYYGNISMQAS
jgi:hypothetical protein